MDVDYQAMGIHFQEEIIMEILSRLPVRTLLRFKCISKVWKILISEPYLKMKHLNHAKNNQNSQKLLITHTCSNEYVVSFYCSSLSSVDVQKLDFPSHCQPVHCALLCCFDGLSLIRVRFGNDVRELYLWNPSTRESIVLPNPELLLEGSNFYGLGYDSTTDDYKILTIGIYRPNRPQVLALKSGSWRKIDEHPCYTSNVFFGMDSLAFLHGAFHWIVSNSNYVISFSISNEVYRKIPLAEQIYRYYRIGFSVLGGMLCAYSMGDYVNYKERDTFKVWVMKDYGDKESWTELYTIRDVNFFEVIPRYWFADGEVLLYWKNCNLSAAFFTSRGPFELWPQFEAHQQGFVFTESLISPKRL